MPGLRHSGRAVAGKASTHGFLGCWSAGCYSNGSSAGVGGRAVRPGMAGGAKSDASIEQAEQLRKLNPPMLRPNFPSPSASFSSRATLSSPITVHWAASSSISQCAQHTPVCAHRSPPVLLQPRVRTECTSQPILFLHSISSSWF